MNDREPIDLTEISPGIYGIKPEDPREYQWQVFWSTIRFLVITFVIVSALGSIFEP